MKKTFILFMFLAIISSQGCNKEIDLTAPIVGIYLGGYGSNSAGAISPYEVEVIRSGSNKVQIRPISGEEFQPFETTVIEFNETTITTPTGNQQALDDTVIFTLGIQVQMSMTLDPSGEAHTFVGEKQ